MIATTSDGNVRHVTLYVRALSNSRLDRDRFSGIRAREIRMQSNERIPESTCHCCPSGTKRGTADPQPIGPNCTLYTHKHDKLSIFQALMNEASHILEGNLKSKPSPGFRFVDVNEVAGEF